MSPTLFHYNLGDFLVDQIADVGTCVSRDFKLISPEVILEVFLIMWSLYLNVTDRQTDGQNLPWRSIARQKLLLPEAFTQLKFTKMPFRGAPELAGGAYDTASDAQWAERDTPPYSPSTPSASHSRRRGCFVSRRLDTLPRYGCGPTRRVP